MPDIPDNSPLWFSGLIFIGIGIIVLLQIRNSNRVQSADATEKISGAYNELLENMRKQIMDLETDVQYLKVQLKKYTNWSAQLMKQLIENGIIPVPPPDTGELKRKTE